MNKKILALAVVGAFAASGTAFADKHGDKMKYSDGAKAHGYAMTTLKITDDANEANEKRFDTAAKLAFGTRIGDNAYGRVDVILNNPYADDEFAVQQAFGMWKAHEMAKVQVGRFNSPLGVEAHNKPDLKTITHGLIRTEILNNQMDVADGNNIEGAAAHLMAGPAKVTVAALNDIGNVVDENSFLLNIAGSPVDGLDLGLGVITQDGDGDVVDGVLRYGNLINFNAGYGMSHGDISWKATLDYITASEVIDNGVSLAGHLYLPHNFSVSLRYDMLQYDVAGDDTNSALTLAGMWKATDGVDLRLEYRNDDREVGDGAGDDYDTIQLAAVFKF